MGSKTVLFALIGTFFVSLVVPPPARAAQDSPAEKTSQMGQPVVIRGAIEKNVFVGDEEVIVRYAVFTISGVKIDKEHAGFSSDRFSVVSLSEGGKIQVGSAEKVNYARIFSVVLKPRVDLPYGVYFIPPLKIRYEYDELVITGSGLIKHRRAGEASAPSIRVEKVPLYVETDTLHEVVHIGDSNLLTVSIHADQAVELLNDQSVKKSEEGIIYLSDFSLKKPLTLLAHERIESVAPSKLYRVVTHRYTYSILDIQKKPYLVPTPPVIWRIKEEGGAKTVFPSATRVTVESLLEKDTQFEPQKGAYPLEQAERLKLLIVPLFAAAAISAALFLWGLFTLVQFLRNYRKRQNRRKNAESAVEEAEEALYYDTSWWARFRLHLKLREALEEYDAQPAQAGCEKLRALVARRSVSRLKRSKRVDRLTAVSMTAAELQNAFGSLPELALLRTLEEQLETGQYKAVRDRAED